MSRPEVVCLTNGAFAENCYIVADADTGDAVLIDPGEEADLFLGRIATEGWALRAVWLTHAHLDHVAGVGRVVEATGVDVFLHPDDRPLYDGVADQARWLGVQIDKQPTPNRQLSVGDRVSVGGLEFNVRGVPGHSPGSVAFVGHGMALVGDALFAGSVGRVDLPGGNGPTLLESIQAELLSLPDETVVYPGHGPSTTIGQERASNPFLTGASPLA